jgi:hypothetical protein
MNECLLNNTWEVRCEQAGLAQTELRTPRIHATAGLLVCFRRLAEFAKCFGSAGQRRHQLRTALVRLKFAVLETE